MSDVGIILVCSCGQKILVDFGNYMTVRIICSRCGDIYEIRRIKYSVK